MATSEDEGLRFTMNPFAWTCPHCSRHTTVTDSNINILSLNTLLPNPDGPQRFETTVISCPNPDCQKITVTLSQSLLSESAGLPTLYWKVSTVMNHWRVIPESSARVFPNYIPAPILEDYEEACKIADASPKASATLSRRCLQGMIRDYFGVKKDRLVEEINAIKDKVDPITWTSIDAVRSIGNIGAHMEKDINLIIDVDEGEAQALIQMIELLLEDWYIQRHNREQKLLAVQAIQQRTQAAKNAGTTAAVSNP